MKLVFMDRLIDVDIIDENDSLTKDDLVMTDEMIKVRLGNYQTYNYTFTPPEYVGWKVQDVYPGLICLRIVDLKKKDFIPEPDINYLIRKSNENYDLAYIAVQHCRDKQAKEYTQLTMYYADLARKQLASLKSQIKVLDNSLTLRRV